MNKSVNEFQLELDTEFAKAIEEFEAEEAKVEAAFKYAQMGNASKMQMASSDEVKEAKKLNPAAYETVYQKAVAKQKAREENEKRRSQNKADAKARAEGVLVFRPSGVWAKRAIKSAKESARWLRLLLDEQEAHKKVSVRIDFFAKRAEKDWYAEWKKNSEPRWYFTSDEKALEIARRAVENAHASALLGYPAKKSAAIFNDELLAVSALIGEDFDVLCELGCKKMFEKKAMYDSLISDVEDELGELRDRREYLMTDLLQEAPYCADALIGTVREEINPQIRKLKLRKAEMIAEVKLINKAIKITEDGANESEAALIRAHRATSNKKARSKEPEVGRTYAPLAKPEMLGFKIPAFSAEYIVPNKVKVAKKALVTAAMEWVKAKEGQKNGEVGDDELHAAERVVFDKFMKLTNIVSDMKKAEEAFEADDDHCQINNARQSQLADVIGVKYGRETDMMISLEHSMANFLPLVVRDALAAAANNASEDKIQRQIDGLETLLLDVLTEFGLSINYKNNGGTRKVHYKFWNANNSALKVGKCYLLSDAAYEIAKDAAQAGMSDDEFESIPTNGSDMLKWWSYATTPGCPMKGPKGEDILVGDVLIVDSVEMNKTFDNVLDFVKHNPDGTVEWQEGILHKNAPVNRTAYDGQLFFMVPIPSQQARGGMAFKGYGLCCAYEDGTTIVDEIAKREGRKIPEYIKDIDGVMRRWRDYKVIATKDAWKWSSYGITYAEYVERMNSLAKKNPAVNKLYTARIADATEESKRHLTRQSTQQLFFGSSEQIDNLISKSVNKINRMRTYDGVIRKLAGLDKPEEERDPFEWLIEAAPEMLGNDLMKRYVEDVFNRQVAEAAVRPEIDGVYPYIAEDPVAFFKIVFWGENPNKLGLGYLKVDQVNVANCKEGQEMYLVRYPNNYACGMIAINHNDDIYRCCGNTMILSIDGYWLIRADGDVDGDEMCAVFTKVVIDMMKQTIKMVNPPLIVFPHGKMKKEIIRGWSDRAYALAKAMVIANKFGPAVGKNSNLAAKLMDRACVARVKVGEAMRANDAEGERKARYSMKFALRDAIIAHIAAIIAIDLAKTGEMPEWLEKRLNAIIKSEYTPKKMPWNQRFCRDSKAMPWFDEDWDKETQKENGGTVNHIARAVVDATNAYAYEAPTGDGYDMRELLCSPTGLYTNGSDGRLSKSMLSDLDARNYKRSTDDGKNEYVLIKSLHSEDKTVSFTDLLTFLWRNQASLMYRLKNKGEDNIDNAAMLVSYQQNVRKIMLRFGSEGGNKTFTALTPEQQEKSNVWKAMKIAFGENSIGKDAETEEARLTAKASFAIFVVKVFAYDIYKMVCDKKGITNVRVLPEENNTDAQSEPRLYSEDDLVWMVA